MGVTKRTYESRRLSGQIGAAIQWSRETDRTARTEPARRGLRAKFAREVDPDGTLPEAEREFRIEQRFRAHMLRMTLASAAARAKRRAA